MTTKIFLEPFGQYLHAIREKGWGNGYVCLPPKHKYHGVPYDDIPVDVHGELSYGKLGKDSKLRNKPEGIEDWWIVGFDTAHLGDWPELWPEARVLAETQYLQEQLGETELLNSIFSL